MAPQELTSWLRLLGTAGVGTESARKLLAAFGPPEAIFQQERPALHAVVGPRLAQALLTPPEHFAASVDAATSWLAGGTNRHILSLDDPRFSPELLQIADPPLLLYLLGQIDTLHHPLRLAIVGSRNPTPQGQQNARQFAQALGEAGVCVVSGLALGIDGAAHEGALAGGAPTIAVVGTGLDRVYPRRHLALAHQIAEQGVLISEYPLGTPPLPPNFPRRNRLIAGLAQGTLVVEAALQSGSLITARMAAEQGREVFAIPGSIHAPQSRGCHALIRQGAKLVESAQDILEDLRVITPEEPARRAAIADPLTDPEGLLKAMGFDPVSLDALQARTGLNTATLQARLLALELDGHIGRLPGGLLQRMAQS